MRIPPCALLLFLLALLFYPSPGLAQQPPLESIRAAEHELATALIKKDREAFERLLAPEFVLRGAPDAGRDLWITNALSMCWGDDYEISDAKVVHAAGDTTVASLVLTTYRDPDTCERAIIRSLLTDVWVRREDGQLQLVLRHSGPAGAGIAAQFAKTAPPPPRWEGTAELSLVATGGNTDTQTLGAGGSLVWRPGAWITRARSNFVRSVAGETTTTESLLAEVRQSRTLSPRAEAFARADYLVNRFSGIDFRTTLDAGIGWTVLQREAGSLELDVGAGAIHESRLAGEDQTFGAATAGLLYRWRLSRTTQIEDRANLSSDLSAPGNWRLENTGSLSVSMTRLLSLKVSHNLKRVSRPVAGFEKIDTILSAALVARF